MIHCFSNTNPIDNISTSVARTRKRRFALLYLQSVIFNVASNQSYFINSSIVCCCPGPISYNTVWLKYREQKCFVKEERKWKWKRKWKPKKMVTIYIIINLYGFLSSVEQIKKTKNIFCFVAHTKKVNRVQIQCCFGLQCSSSLVLHRRKKFRQVCNDNEGV